MLKGVNKIIIEVNDTGNEYFEKAVFYIRPEYANKQSLALEQKVKKYIDDLEKPEKTEYFDIKGATKKRRRLALVLSGYLIALATVLFLIFR